MADRDRPGGRGIAIGIAILAVLVILPAVFWFAILPGLSVARRPPPRVEVGVATWLLHNSVPAAARDAVNPLGARPDPAALAAGHDLYTAKCETCHAFD